MPSSYTGTPAPCPPIVGASMRGGAREVPRLWMGLRRGAQPRNANCMIVVTNRIPVAEGHEIDFEDRFRHRAHLVDTAPGFVRNEVHRPRPLKFERATATFVHDPDAQGFYEVKTWWRTLEDFAAWTQSEAFAEAHKNRAPKEMFAGPNVIEFHEVFTSTDLELGQG